MFEDVLLRKIMNVIFLDSKYLAVFENAGFTECFKFQKGGGSTLSEVLHVFSILHLYTHLPSCFVPLFIKPNWKHVYSSVCKNFFFFFFMPKSMCILVRVLGEGLLVA